MSIDSNAVSFFRIHRSTFLPATGPAIAREGSIHATRDRANGKTGLNVRALTALP